MLVMVNKIKKSLPNVHIQTFPFTLRECAKIAIISEAVKSLLTSVPMLIGQTTRMVSAKTAICLHTIVNDVLKTKSLLKNQFKLMYCPSTFHSDSDIFDLKSDLLS
jgi:hypothetical protein